MRLDLLRATRHDRHARDDYRRCMELGICSIRDGIRWHVIARSAHGFDWSSWTPMLHAASEVGVQVIWDFFHYGWPDRLDCRSDEFVAAYAEFAAEAVRVHRAETGKAPLVCPLNEISFFSWAIETRYFPPAITKPVGWIKRHLVRCAIVGVEAMRAAEPECRFIWAEPLIHVAPRDHSPEEIRRAENYRQAQFEVYDMLTGRSLPELGGRPDMLDCVGLNFYPHNQWYFEGPTIPMGHHEYRPLANMLTEVSERYAKPIFLSETGAEGSGRPAWLHYVCDEVRTAMGKGIDFSGICLYPVTAYPGWDNSRHAEVGLFSVPLADGQRLAFEPLVTEVARQRDLFVAGGYAIE